MVNKRGFVFWRTKKWEPKPSITLFHRGDLVVSTWYAHSVGYMRNLFSFSNLEDFVPFLSHSPLFHLFPCITFPGPSISPFLCAIQRRDKVVEWKLWILHWTDLGLHLHHLASGFPLWSYISSCEDTEINSTSQNFYKRRWYLENVPTQLLTQNECSIIITHYCSIFTCVEIPLPIWI